MQQNEPLDLSFYANSQPILSQKLNEDIINRLVKQTICDRIRPVNLARPDISKIKFLDALELKPMSLSRDAHDVPPFGYAVNDGFLRGSRYLRTDIRPYTSIYWSILAHHNIQPRRECKQLDSNEPKADDLPLDLSVKKGKLEPTSNSKSNLKSAVKQKQKRYRTEKPFECIHCAARFTLRSNMIRHIKQQHAEFLRRRREGRKLPHELAEFSREQNDPARDWPPEISLDECEGTPFPMPSSYYFKGDDGEDDSSYSDYYLLSTNAASKKKSAYSTAPNRVSCPYCSREFPWNSSLRRHILTHTGQRPFKCDSCPLLFTTKSNCDRHTSRKHTGSRKMAWHKGSESGDTIGSEADSSQDTQDEMPGPYEAPFKCHLCDSAFPDRQEALDHLKDEHSRDCPSLIPKLMEAAAIKDSSSDTADEINDPSISRFQNHFNNRKVICALCQRRFWSAEDLRRHMRTHTGERPFSCELCSRRFTLKHSMLRHMKKHQSGFKK